MNAFVRNTRSTRSVRSAVPLNVGALEVPVTIPGYNGLIHKNDLANPLSCEMQSWVGVTPLMELQLYWDGTNPADAVTGAFHEVQPAEAADPNFVYKLSVPVSYLTEGPHKVWMRALPLGGGSGTFSNSVDVIVDLTPPGGNAFPAPRFTSGIEVSNEITEVDIIEVSPGVRGVLGEVSHYEGIARGDRLTPMIDTTIQPDGFYDLLTEPVPGQFLPIVYSEAALNLLAPGLHDFGYEAVDKAGNDATTLPGTQSVRRLNVNIQALPGTLLPPVVPAFDDHGLVTYEDSKLGVVVEVPRYPNPSFFHEIELLWGSAVVTPRIRVTSLTADPIVEFTLDYDFIRAAQLPDIASVNVQYRIYRNNTPLNPASPITPITVDLSNPGGGTDDPWPENSNLAPLTAFGASNVADHISNTDLQSDGAVVIPWFSVDTAYELAVDDGLTLNWGTLPALQLNPVSTLEAAQRVAIRRVVPQQTLVDGGGGLVPVSYSVTRDLSVPPNVATAKAPDKSVTVDSSSDYPGGGSLPQPEFIDLKQPGNNVIGPDQLKLYPPLTGRYNPVRIPLMGVSNLDVGDTVWIAFRGFDALVAGNEIPTARYDSTPFPLTRTELDQGYYDVLVPERYHYAICSLGRAEAQSHARNAKGTSSSPIYTSIYCDVKCAGWPDCANWETGIPCRSEP